MTAPRLLCVATHHKGGTVWIKQIVHSLSAALNIPWVGVWGQRQVQDIPLEGRAFLVNWHGYFPTIVWKSTDAAFLHVIRDPRDILLSGCQYHQTAGPKGEKFLHTPREDLGGKTYQEHLNALDTEEEKLLFEMRGKHAETLREMREWPNDHPAQMTLCYEDLMQDKEAKLFDTAMDHWGLNTQEKAKAKEIFFEKSLFGGTDAETARKGHVQSGKIERWKTELPKNTAHTYIAEFGDDLIALGYANDKKWDEYLRGGQNGQA